MSADIKTAQIDPLRHTFATVARRFGDKPASRYQEASFDLQPLDNFHYRPVWDPQRELYDRTRTVIQMRDWDAFRDPRQFYYAAYVINRSKLQEAAERNLDLIEKLGLVAQVPAEVKQRWRDALLPLRHAEWGANQANCQITAYGFGSSITQGAMFATTDRLGLAQHLSRFGLLLDGNTGESLTQAKQAWLQAPALQPLRRLCENQLVLDDWFELFVARNLAFDGLLYSMLTVPPADELPEPARAVLVMVNEFLGQWFADASKWVDACLKTAADDSAANREQLSGWFDTHARQAGEALAPWAAIAFPGDGERRLADATAALQARAVKLGLATAKNVKEPA